VLDAGIENTEDAGIEIVGALLIEDPEERPGP
jgi:hypothetical protein